ncbi:hypothetical protein EXN66_Car008406 [Channa argus]|uniref:Uncharacterized protein n=1 Tax=Channa argus TaxID=215402 RepID=A0A6G1PR02_CHAAH|nr:hypothetical protein EXN66_Car008406 [Channa argus]
MLNGQKRPLGSEVRQKCSRSRDIHQLYVPFCFCLYQHRNKQGGGLWLLGAALCSAASYAEFTSTPVLLVVLMYRNASGQRSFRGGYGIGGIQRALHIF